MVSYVEGRRQGKEGRQVRNKYLVGDLSQGNPHHQSSKVYWVVLTYCSQLPFSPLPCSAFCGMGNSPLSSYSFPGCFSFGLDLTLMEGANVFLPVCSAGGVCRWCSWLQVLWWFQSMLTWPAVTLGSTGWPLGLGSTLFLISLQPRYSNSLCCVNLWCNISCLLGLHSSTSCACLPHLDIQNLFKTHWFRDRLPYWAPPS